MEKIYNVGIIGFGFIGKVHAYGYENLKYYYPDSPFRAKVFGICTSREETAKNSKKLYGIEFITTDYRKIIENPKIDIIDISSPNNYHYEQLLYAIKKNKHIYCEKPVVSNIEEAEKLEKKLKNFNRIHQVTFHNRFIPATIKTKELIESGFIGKPTIFRIAYYHSGSVEKEKPITWRFEKGAGVLLDLGSHIIDLIYWFLGEFDEVIGNETILYPERPTKNGKFVKIEVEDHIIINVKMKNGCVGIIEASKIATGTIDELKYEIYGTKGAIRFNSENLNYLEVFSLSEGEGFKKIFTGGNYKESCFPGIKFTAGWTRAHIHSIYNFIKGIYENKQVSPSLYDGIYNMKVIDKIKKSVKEKTFVTV
ncbi:MAG: Gfo/Idh/MocA family oxidoreductase [Candidatus Omnitrophica bacterium]|nr:Gfo/Idh/MocA family oxidoreductase [Candidatus Omnitrophota bacterium]MCM8801927.1 Gfo/Idh/MocA family oxidoreductase [Candidatus Omnitrophota bacterium]